MILNASRKPEEWAQVSRYLLHLSASPNGSVHVKGSSAKTADDRARKLRCDATRPICRRCVRSKRDCQGYAVWEVGVSLPAHGGNTKAINEDTYRDSHCAFLISNDNSPSSQLSVDQCRQITSLATLHAIVDQGASVTVQAARKLRRHADDCTNPQSAPLCWIGDSEVYRNALAATHLSKLHGTKGLKAFNADRQIVDMVTLKTTAAIEACTALELLGVGAMCGDERISLEGRRKHMNAVCSLRQALGRVSVKPGRNKPDVLTETVSAACALLACECYGATSSGSHSWSVQLTGIASLLHCSMLSTSQPSHLGNWMFRKIRHVTLMYGLVNWCETISLEDKWTPVWMNCTPNEVESLIRIALELPSVLQLVRQTKDPSMLNRLAPELLEKLHRVEQDLRRWQVEPQQVPVQSSWLKSVIDYMAQTFYWMCLLVVQHARFKLLTSSGVEDRGTTEIDKVAEALCTSMLVLVSSADSQASKAVAIAAPLACASSWYRDSGNDGKERICSELKESVLGDAPDFYWANIIPWSLLTLAHA